MREVEYEHELGENAFARVRFQRERKRIQSFVVQLERVYDGERHIIIRYDTSHGFAHSDTMRPNRPETKIELNLDFNRAFTYAQRDISQNWKFYCERYERWLNESRKQN